MKQVIFVLLASALAGCGGYHQAKRDVGRAPPAPAPVTAPIAITPTVVGVTTPGVTPAAAPAATQTAAVRPQPKPAPVRKPFARGPIQSACQSSDRKARSRELCGCIQAVADQSLTRSQQSLAVSFYDDPHRAQEIRQSDRESHRDFWEAYKAYGDAAERSCG